ncbi:uncharacterized protein C2845_PM04G01500 [Panicum miliaceum]|uniref:Integral membrane bound transporter domain-containing protein n=1 Tax=Panicum miliaceum TaxID=4540 RepID=A0A3L6QL51_PANMI|nr:uncharacterized protein C2845_PM04G01500 [Panicum miliaceum]
MGRRRWRSSLASGLRAALACTIVGLASLYAPPALRRHITFPAFSYVVTVIIVTDATVGTALRGAVSALHATLMGAVPSVLALWLAHRTGAAESVLATSAVVALTAFAVALPESVVPVAKRIALGQIIIIYVARFQQGERPTRDFALMHPANVVACTALGVAAALLAVLLPAPRLATREARDKTRAYRALAAERVRVMADAAIAVVTTGEAACSRQRRWQMAARTSEANRLASASTALLHRVNAIKDDVRWERGAVDDGMAAMVEMPLTGMQMALAMMMDNNCKQQLLIADHHHHNSADLIMEMRDQIRLALLTPNNKQTYSSAAAAGGGFIRRSRSNSKPQISLCLPRTTTLQPQQLAPCLFLFSLYQLRGAASGCLLVANNNANASVNNKVAPAATAAQESEEAATAGSEGKRLAHNNDDDCSTTTKNNNDHCWFRLHRRRLVAAAKCGFSLGLAVLLGLLFSNDHGFWSGLIVATTITTGCESTWVVAAARAHGTALGSVYGALGCLLISQQRLLTMDLRFLALLPWMVLATFLKRSRAYGPAGGVAAALSGIIIMGRRYDEPAMAFTVARLVETFIGISCAVLADIIFQPGARPSVQAREQLTRCIIAALAAADDPSSQSLQLNKSLQQLRRHAAEAGSEPSYLWLPPFPAACYDKIQGSLGRMAQLLHLYHQARMAVDVGDDDMFQRRFSSLVSSSLRHCLRMLQAPAGAIMSSSSSSPDHQEAKDDLEAGNAAIASSCSCCCKEHDQEEATTTPEEVVDSFLAHAAGEAAALLDDDDDDAEEERGLLVCCLASMGLCMAEIIREAHRLEANIVDLNN